MNPRRLTPKVRILLMLALEGHLDTLKWLMECPPPHLNDSLSV